MKDIELERSGKITKATEENLLKLTKHIEKYISESFLNIVHCKYFVEFEHAYAYRKTGHFITCHHKKNECPYNIQTRCLEISREMKGKIPVKNELEFILKEKSNFGKIITSKDNCILFFKSRRTFIMSFDKYIERYIITELTTNRKELISASFHFEDNKNKIYESFKKELFQGA